MDFGFHKKNKADSFNIEITDVTSEGVGVGRHNGIAVMIPNTLPGDTVLCEVQKEGKTCLYGAAMEIILPSPMRTKSPCSAFPLCGGCSFMNVRYEDECKIKEKWVSDSIKRIGKCDTEILPIIPSPKELRYRNKAIYQAGKDKQGNIIFGFYKAKSHDVVDAANCMLQPEIFRQILLATEFFCREKKLSVYNENSGKGLIRALYIRYGEKTGEIGVTFVINGENIPHIEDLVHILTTNYKGIVSIVININTKKTNVVLGDRYKTVYGMSVISDVLCDRRFNISPASFYQVNHDGAEILYNTAKEYIDLKDDENLMDFYCGTGTIGLCVIGEKGNLIGVEIVPEAVENAKLNASLNKIKNARFICGDAGETAGKLLADGIKTDALIVDPPRKGVSPDTIECIAKIDPKRIVYVSCGHSTLARDILLFKSFGYVPVKIQPVDMFPKTCNVETVVLLCRI